VKRTVRQIHRKRNVDQPAAVPPASGRLDEAETSDAAVIQALIPVALARLLDVLKQEVETLAGPRYAHDDAMPDRVRWGHQRGSVYLGDQKVALAVPRVRDRARNQEVPLPTYTALQAPRELDRRLLHAVLGGLSTREYGRCVQLVPETFGVSASTVSRRFRRASLRYLRALQDRPLAGYPLVALVLDGKTFAEDAMVLAVGITVTGQKIILGIVQTATENRPVCSAFLQSLLDRGLRLDAGLLVIIDGAKGLRAAVHAVFGARGLVQRCQWHKRENVVRYLPKAHQAVFRRKLQAAYERPTYEQARRALQTVRRELQVLNSSAVASLDEGLEETLTLHRLGVFRSLGQSLKTTNVLESINARVASRTDKVDHWRNSEQKHRWLATTLLDLEPRLNRIKGYAALPALQQALRRAVNAHRTEAVA
jgi:putative transposase